MKNKYIVSALLLVASVIFISVLVGCDYITGEAVETASLHRWDWSADDSGYSIVIERVTRQKIRDVTPEEAYLIIGTSSRLGNPVVIDVRTPQEYAGGHLRDALNIDVNSAGFRDEI